MPRTRKETDALGTLNISNDKWYGIHTQRSINNFQISNQIWNKEIIYAMLKLKKACTKANLHLKNIEKTKADAIIKAILKIERECKKESEVIKEYFPLDVYQAGSGTSTNMNVNEVIANKANEIVKKPKGSKFIHPNDDVNKGQSTNNVIPSSIRIAATTESLKLVKEITKLTQALKKKAKEFQSIVKSGRTHLQDAVPITLGQEFHAYASAIEKHKHRIEKELEIAKHLGIGGNAVGTGLNTKPSFRREILHALNQESNSKFIQAADGIEATQFLTDLAALHTNIKLLAIDINKIANDLRLLSSGPNTGLGEIELPAVEPGSSIMPGKVNPSICESANMAMQRVMGNDTTITIASTSGNLDLNTHMPLIGNTLMESLTLATNTIATLNEKCIKGIKANKQQCSYHVENSLGLATALNPHLGYDKVSKIVKEAKKSNKSIITVAKKYISEKELKRILNPKNLTKPNIK